MTIKGSSPDDSPSSSVSILNRKSWANYIKGKKSRDSSKTHVSMIKPKGNFYISNTDVVREEFFQQYTYAVTHGRKIGVAEYPRPVMPVLGDADLRFDPELGLGRRYTKTHIINIVKCYQDALKYLYLNVSEKHLRVVVLEKGDMMRMSDDVVPVVKDGFHWHFPYAQVDNMEQRTQLRNKVIEFIYERKVLDDLNTTNTVENIIDRNIPNVTWLMYLSRKDENALPWKATFGIDGNGNECLLEDIFDTDDVDDALLIRALSVTQPDITALVIKPECLPSEEDFIVHNAKLGDREIAEIKGSLKKVVEPYLKLINAETWDNENEWMELGWTLHNLSKGQEDGLDLWVKYSKKSSKFKEGECEKKWERMRAGRYNMGTIIHYAKRDSPKKYLTVRSKVEATGVYQMLGCTVYQIARFIKMYFEGEFICSDIKTNEWWRFKGHCWKKCEQGNELYLRIPEDIVQQIRNYSEDLANQQLTDADLADKRKRCDALRTKLEDTTFLDKIMKMLKHMFYDPEFNRKKDTNNNLLCFQNGVLVMDGARVWLRDGRPTDLITRQMRVELDINMPKTDPRYVKLKKFLRQVFTNKNIRRYFKRWVSSCYRGGNVNKLFIIWIGEGNNGKSITSELLEELFGELMFKFPIGTLIGKHAEGGAATADLVRMQGMRIAGFQEPPKGSKINMGLLKELTGGDSMYVRGLFKEGHEVKPDMKTFLQCNHAPKAPTYDRAFYNRLRMIMFSSEFTPEAPVDEEEQMKLAKFPMDSTFRRWLPYLAPALASMMYKSYLKYAREGLIAPDEVMARTNKYRKSNDTLMEFIDENITEDRDETQIRKCAMLKEIYTIHKTWFKDNFPGCKIPEMLDFKEDLTERWGEPVLYKGHPRWMGIKIKTIDSPTKKESKDENKDAKPETERPSKVDKKKKKTQVNDEKEKAKEEVIAKLTGDGEKKKKTRKAKTEAIEKVKALSGSKASPVEGRRRSSRLSGKGA